MRIVNERSVNGCKITFYSWNNRYIVKIEQGFLEQTFKLDQFEVVDENELLLLIDDLFLKEATTRFEEMARSFGEARQRLY